MKVVYTSGLIMAPAFSVEACAAEQFRNFAFATFVLDEDYFVRVFAGILRYKIGGKMQLKLCSMHRSSNCI